jgi:hypothetical protein
MGRRVSHHIEYFRHKFIRHRTEVPWVTGWRSKPRKWRGRPRPQGTMKYKHCLPVPEWESWGSLCNPFRMACVEVFLVAAAIGRLQLAREPVVKNRDVNTSVRRLRRFLAQVSTPRRSGRRTKSGSESEIFQFSFVT